MSEPHPLFGNRPPVQLKPACGPVVTLKDKTAVNTHPPVKMAGEAAPEAKNPAKYREAWISANGMKAHAFLNGRRTGAAVCGFAITRGTPGETLYKCQTCLAILERR